MASSMRHAVALVVALVARPPRRGARAPRAVLCRSSVLAEDGEALLEERDGLVERAVVAEQHAEAHAGVGRRWRVSPVGVGQARWPRGRPPGSCSMVVGRRDAGQVDEGLDPDDAGRRRRRPRRGRPAASGRPRCGGRGRPRRRRAWRPSRRLVGGSAAGRGPRRARRGGCRGRARAAWSRRGASGPRTSA